MADDYVPFEEALKSLKMNEAELKRLVSQAEIQAVRDQGGSIQLRREDIDKLLRQQTDELAEELVFADDDEIGMATEVLDEDSLLEEDDTLDLGAEAEDVRDVEVPRPVRSRSRASAIRQEEESGEESTFDKAMLIASSVMLLFTLFVVFAITRGQTNGMTAWLADFFKV